MNISKALRLYSQTNPDVLKNPEKYFGQNYETALNYWAFLDTLTYEQKQRVRGKYLTHPCSGRVFECYRKATGCETCTNMSDYSDGYIALAMPFYEIIGMHLLLDAKIEMFYIKMFEDL
jgi:hypothetical protein